MNTSSHLTSQGPFLDRGQEAKAKRPNRKVDSRAWCPVIRTQPSVLLVFVEEVVLVAVWIMLGSEAPSIDHGKESNSVNPDRPLTGRWEAVDLPTNEEPQRPCTLEAISP